MPEPADSRDGRVVTFYSFKGGTGRTMALANVAWILAANGKRVLVADWDLESPGLHRFYHPFMQGVDVQDTGGIIDLVRDYEWDASPADGKAPAPGVAERSARVQGYAFSLDWPHFPGEGCLDFLSAGRQNNHYAATLGALDWDNFWDKLKGATFFRALKKNMTSLYDYVLIDSRTGLSDVADICTVDLPDILVDCFTLSTQGIEGAAHVAREVTGTFASRGIRVLPVPMRVDPAEKERADAGQAFALRLFPGLPAGMTESEQRAYWAAVEVPYRPFYAYEETLAVFADSPGSPTSLLASFERIASYVTEGEITSLPPMDDRRRLAIAAQFTRRPPADVSEIALQYVAEDEVWAEWITSILERAGIKVYTPGAEGRPDGDEGVRRVLLVVSTSELAEPITPYYVVHVSEARPLVQQSRASAQIQLAGLTEDDAVEHLLRMFGLGHIPVLELTQASEIRFPGTEPTIMRAPARNFRFVGREEDLRALRRHLHAQGRAVVLPQPVALQGLGGVGKTQVALEYVHRFKSDYDLIWWVDSGQTAFVDTLLADLGQQMIKPYNLSPPAGASVSEVARLVLQTLRSRAVDRWLLVFDNAEDIEEITPFIPEGKGHVLITSRNRQWSERGANALPMDVFTREESVAYLRERAPSINEEDAERVAASLGDLPLAVATAGAWLAETGVSVQDYVSELDRQGPRALSVGQLGDYPAPVARAWDLSLDRLEERSPAAARLFELCSLLAPTIHLDLIYNPAMADVLSAFDPALSEPMVIGRVVQEINRLALIKLDTNARQIHIHRLVQAVVRGRMTAAREEEARKDVHRILAASQPRREVDDSESWARYRLLWPHLATAEAMTSEDESVRQLFIDRVRYLYLRGDFARGLEIATECQDTWREMRDASEDSAIVQSLPRQILQLQFNLSNLLRSLGRFEAARSLDETVLRGQRRLLGGDHPHTLMTAGSLAGSLRALGDYRGALEMDNRTFPAWRETYGDDHARTLAAANNLAVSHRVNGDFKIALNLDEDTYERRRNTLGPSSQRTLESGIAICRDLLESGRYAEAVTRMEQVYESCFKELGGDSQTTLHARLLLAIALRSVGHSQAAQGHFQDTMTELAARFGENSNDALSARLSNASNRLALDEIEAAEGETRTVLEAYERGLGDLHPYTLVCRLNLASALRLSGQYAESLQVIEQTAARLGDALGTDHPYTLAAQMVRAVVLFDEGHGADSAELEQWTHAKMIEVLGPAHPDTLRCQANMLLTREQLGDARQGEARREVIARLERVLGKTHPNIETLTSRRRLLRAVDPQPF